jgi:hypothetical protein
MEEFWQMKAVEVLQGKTITKVEYISKEVAEKNGWHKRGIMMELNDGIILTILSDDEGNDMGVIEWYREEHYCGILPSL